MLLSLCNIHKFYEDGRTDNSFLYFVVNYRPCAEGTFSIILIVILRNLLTCSNGGHEARVGKNVFKWVSTIKQKKDGRNEAWSRPCRVAKRTERVLLHLPRRDGGPMPRQEVPVRGAVCRLYRRSQCHLWVSHAMPGLRRPRWITASVWKWRRRLQGPVRAEARGLWRESGGHSQVPRQMWWVAIFIHLLVSFVARPIASLCFRRLLYMKNFHKVKIRKSKIVRKFWLVTVSKKKNCVVLFPDKLQY